MGTNFYFYADESEHEHIGKRSAAGPYCWDCGVTLCSTSVDSHTGKSLFGSDSVHHSPSHWLDCCPCCDAKETKEHLDESTAGRELGFNKTKPGAKTGVASCCSFTWAISPSRFADLKTAPNISIRDEYGTVYSNEEFRDVLKECPIKYYRSVGVEFC
jgi:hypothetical protein